MKIFFVHAFPFLTIFFSKHTFDIYSIVLMDSIDSGINSTDKKETAIIIKAFLNQLNTLKRSTNIIELYLKVGCRVCKLILPHS